MIDVVEKATMMLMLWDLSVEAVVEYTKLPLEEVLAIKKSIDDFKSERIGV